MTSGMTMQSDSRDTISSSSGWFLAIGILFLIGGILALAMPILTSIVLASWVGIALAVVGVFQIVHSFRVGDWGPFLWQLLVGAVMLAGGIAIFLFPVTGALTIAWLLAAIWIAKGVMEIMFALRLRPASGWGWVAGAGALSIIVGAIVLAAWPVSGLTVPGILVGISLLFTGWSYLMLAVAGRRVGA